MDELLALCVTRFPLSLTRGQLFSRLLELISLLDSKGVFGEMWVDGSFATEKIDPEDIDLLLLVPDGLVSVANQDVRIALDWITSPEPRKSHGCHSFLVVRFPPDHHLHDVGAAQQAYWENWFGHDRAGNPKGIPAIQIGVRP